MPHAAHIAVVAMDVRLPGEVAGLDREAYIAGQLADAGYDVDLVTSSFQHWEKQQRDTTDSRWNQLPYRVHFVDAPSYARNITPARMRNHAQVARAAAALLAQHDYDLVIAKVPPNDLARAAARYARERGIPLVADVNDLWPEAMRLVLDSPATDALLAPMRRDADAVYASASAVVGTSDDYARRALAAPGVAGPALPGTPGLPGAPQLLTVHVGDDLAAFDAEAARTAPLVDKPQGQIWATYAGTLGASYALDTLVRAAALAAQAQDPQAPALRVKLLGSGPEQPALESLAAQLSAPIDFLGYLPHDQMAGYLARSDLLVNSFAARAPQSIVSKVGGYLASGKPLVNTLANAEFMQMVERNGCGVNVPPEDPVELAAALLELAASPTACTRMGQAARALAETEFDRPVIYQAFVDLVGSLLR